MDKAKRTVLVVEDSIAFSYAIEEAFSLKHDYEVIIAITYKQTVELYEKHKDSIFTAITDLILPDEEDGAEDEQAETDANPSTAQQVEEEPRDEMHEQEKPKEGESSDWLEKLGDARRQQLNRPRHRGQTQASQPATVTQDQQPRVTPPWKEPTPPWNNEEKGGGRREAWEAGWKHNSWNQSGASGSTGWGSGSWCTQQQEDNNPKAKAQDGQ